MNRKLLFLAAVAVCVVFSAAVLAAQPSIVGIWSVPIEQGKDKGKERSQIEIFEKQGVYYGKNVKLNNVPAGILCRKCMNDKKDKPILGMLILRDLKKEGNRYVGGKILQVESGDEFSCTIELMTPDKMKLTAGWLFSTEDHYLMRVK